MLERGRGEYPGDQSSSLQGLASCARVPSALVQPFRHVFARPTSPRQITA